MRYSNVNRPQRAGGYAVVQTIGFIMLSLFIAGIAVDFGYYFTAQNQLQSAADASALAGTQELYTGAATDATTRQADAKTEAANLVGTYGLEGAALQIDSATDVTFGYVDPTTGVYNPATFATASNDPNYAATGGYNATRVTVRKQAGSPSGPLSSVLMQLVGVNTMSTRAIAVAMMDAQISQVTSGLRPFYACQAQFNLANADGNPSNNKATIFGPTVLLDDQPVTGCPSNPNGNWGFADLRDGESGAPGANTIVEWLLNGYNGTVVTGDDYYLSSNSGDFITSAPVRDALTSLRDNGTVITLAMIDSSSGSGSNTAYHVVSYVGFVIDNFDPNGPPDSRSVWGHFTEVICSANCNGGGPIPTGTGAVKLRLVH